MIYTDDMVLVMRTATKLFHQQHHTQIFCHMSSDIEGEADKLAKRLRLNPNHRRCFLLRRVYWFMPRKKMLTPLWSKLAHESVTSPRFMELTRKPYISS